LKERIPIIWLLLIVKYIGTQETKSGKGDVEAPDSAIRVRILYESDPTLYLFMALVVSRNGEFSFMLSIIIGMYEICMCPINIKSKNL